MAQPEVHRREDVGKHLLPDIYSKGQQASGTEMPVESPPPYVPPPSVPPEDPAPKSNSSEAVLQPGAKSIQGTLRCCLMLH